MAAGGTGRQGTTGLGRHGFRLAPVSQEWFILGGSGAHEQKVSVTRDRVGHAGAVL